MYYYYQIIIKKSEHRCAICRAKERKKERTKERRASAHPETLNSARGVRESGASARWKTIGTEPADCLPVATSSLYSHYRASGPGDLHKCIRRGTTRGKSVRRVSNRSETARPPCISNLFARTSSRTRALNSADTPGSSRCRSTRRRSAPFQFQTHAIFDFILLLLLNDENLSISYTTYCYNLREKEETIILLGFS